MDIHYYTRFQIIYSKYMYVISPSIDHMSFCMVSLYFLSVFQRATFETVIHITYNGT
jgi:hypothetical protein